MTPDIFQEALTKAEQWLQELNATLHPEDDRQAVRALRAGLHAIRDRLPAREVVDLGAQLPVLIRGLYYEGWSFSNDPTRIRTTEQLLEQVRHELRDPRLDPEAVIRAVIHVLAWHVTGGELDDIKSTLPRPIAALWEEAMA
jgi:uncharacterized protein (DUF2267 family)